MPSICGKHLLIQLILLFFYLVRTGTGINSACSAVEDPLSATIAIAIEPISNKEIKNMVSL